MILLAVGCSGGAAESGDTIADAGSETIAGITAAEVGDVWIFTHRPSGGDDALHGGRASIVDGCLYVDDTVIIWHIDDLARVDAVVRQVHSGAEIDLTVGGGGISLEEGGQADQIPQVIRDRCRTRAVWFASGG